MLCFQVDTVSSVREYWCWLGRGPSAPLRAGSAPSPHESSVVDVIVFLYPDYATMRRLAHHVFQLDRRMVDAKPLAEFFVDLAENGVALRRRHVRNLDVCREGVILRSDAPQMQVVHVADAGNRPHRGLYCFQVDAARGALEQNVQRLADDAYARPQNQRADPE